MVTLRFDAKLTPAGDGGAWTGIFLTEAQSAALGSRGRVPTVLSVNGCEFKAFAAPMGDGTHGIVVNKTMQKAAGVAQNEIVAVTLRIDSTPRTVEVPAELADRLAASATAKRFFDELSYTHQKDFVTWIMGAKRPATKEKRLAETVRLLEAGVKWKDK